MNTNLKLSQTPGEGQTMLVLRPVFLCCVREVESLTLFICFNKLEKKSLETCFQVFLTIISKKGNFSLSLILLQGRKSVGKM